MAERTIRIRAPEIDATGVRLFNDPDGRKIAGMIGDRPALELLGSVAKLDKQYLAGKIGLGAWEGQVIMLATDRVLPAGSGSEKLKEMLKQSFVEPGILSSMQLALKFPDKELKRILGITDLLKIRVVAQKCGIGNMQAKELLETRLTSKDIEELTGKARLLNAQRDTGTITSREWDERIGKAIFAINPAYPPYEAKLLRDKLAGIEPAERGTAVYRKVRQL
jgi:hypothetical protein